MIKSMTAFARAETLDENQSISAEIRSYNSRHLDISLKLPHGYQTIEAKVKSLVAETAARGRVEIRIHIHDTSEEANVYEVNAPKARAYHKALLEMNQMLGLDQKISADTLLSAGVIQAVENEKDMDKLWPQVKSCLVDALSDLDAMRKKEGDHMAADFNSRLDFIEKTMTEIEKDSDKLPLLYKERLVERIAALTGGVVEIDPSRIAQEAAILADRSDISEEIVRAKSHVKQFRQIMASKAPAGRKLNFLLQEFNREFNTMGSKTGKADIAHMIVAVKSELEKLREQVQNIE